MRGVAVVLGLERRLRASLLWDWAGELCAVASILSPASVNAVSARNSAHTDVGPNDVLS